MARQVYYWDWLNSVSGGFLAPSTVAMIDDIGRLDSVRGPAHAPVTLIEYGDYECQRCGRAHRILEALLAELGPAVRFVFRNFPLTELHPHAQLAAEAAESVCEHADDETFWAMHDMLFENQDALEIDDVVGYAEAAGVDPARVASDLSSGAMTERVRAEYRSGVRAGVTSTPTFFINGRRFEGNWPDPAAFAKALHAAMLTTLRG
jgi:protein-disulfide isomerase